MRRPRACLGTVLTDQRPLHAQRERHAVQKHNPNSGQWGIFAMHMLEAGRVGYQVPVANESLPRRAALAKPLTAPGTIAGGRLRATLLISDTFAQCRNYYHQLLAQKVLTDVDYLDDSGEYTAKKVRRGQATHGSRTDSAATSENEDLDSPAEAAPRPAPTPAPVRRRRPVLAPHKRVAPASDASSDDDDADRPDDSQSGAASRIMSDAEAPVPRSEPSQPTDQSADQDAVAPPPPSLSTHRPR